MFINTYKYKVILKRAVIQFSHFHNSQFYYVVTNFIFGESYKWISFWSSPNNLMINFYTWSSTFLDYLLYLKKSTLFFFDKNIWCSLWD